jgi:hypothetical protein
LLPIAAGVKLKLSVMMTDNAWAPRWSRFPTPANGSLGRTLHETA